MATTQIETSWDKILNEENVKRLMSQELYQYKPLDCTKREIRLLKVENIDEVRSGTAALDDQCNGCSLREADDVFNLLWSGQCPVRCSIECVSLDEDPRYVALSYTWGDPRHKVPILVEDARFMVTQSLNQALRHVLMTAQVEGQEAESCKIWSDAICINQADEKEKQWQVQQMYSIYHCADYTAVWLGLATDDSDVLVEQIGKIFLNLEVKAHSGLLDLDRINDVNGWVLRVLNMEPLKEFLSVSAFSSFIHRPYWSRVWIQQELQASQNCYFHCGSKRIPRDEIVMMMAIVIPALQQDIPWGLRLEDPMEWKQLALLDERALDMTSYAARRYRDRSDDGKATITLVQALEDVNVKGYGLQATDARDHIYGLLSLASDAEALGVVPDYAKPYPQLYVEVAQALIETQGLRILTFCNSMTDEMPSWAPDWRKPILRPFEMAKECKSYSYSASGDRCGQFRFEAAPRTFPILHVDGIMVDCIFATGKPMQDPHFTCMGFSTKNFLDYAEWLVALKLLSLCVLPQVYKDADAVKQAVWRTPIADLEPVKDEGWVRARNSFEKAYDFWNELENFTQKERILNDEFLIKYLSMLRVFSGGRKYFVTERGYLGLGPQNTKRGDLVAVIFGLQVPFVLRHRGDGKWRIVGETYVHGVMDGEMATTDQREMEFEIC